LALRQIQAIQLEACQSRSLPDPPKRIIQNNSKIYYCCDCGNNFRA
jgi:hypothetical protein